MKTVGILLLWLLAGALLMAGYVLLLIFFHGDTSGTLSSQEILGALNSVAVVLCFGLTCFALGLLWKLLKALFPLRKDDDALLRRGLIALCISAVLFQDFYGSIVRVIVSSTVQLFSGLSADLDQSSLRRLIGETGDSSWPEAVGHFWALLRIFFQSLTLFLTKIFRSFTTTDAVLAYVAWMLSYFAMARAAKTEDERASAPIRRFKEWLGSMDEVRRDRFIQSAVFLAGCYLSIAAMVAIPSLKKQVIDTSATREKLQSVLEAAAIPQSEFDRDYPENQMAARNPFESLKKYLTKPPSLDTSSTSDLNLQEKIAPAWKSQLDSANEALKEAEAQRTALVIRWQNYRREMNELNQSLSKKAISSLDADTLVPQAGPERAAYFQDIKVWHRNSVANVQRNLRQSMTFTEYLDAELNVASESLVAKLGDEFSLLEFSLKAGTPPPDSGALSSLDYELRRFRGVVGRGLLTRNFLPEKPDIEGAFPSPREPGDFTGPFGFIARWLLRTRSFSLALITGMIGFGLFGASIAQIIRASLADPAKTVSPDFAGRTIVQGLSAAVVIYLAVQGGLVLVSGGDSEPNGYVLCFLCFVGSVFSDKVWRWAGKHLNAMLVGKGNTETGK